MKPLPPLLLILLSLSAAGADPARLVEENARLEQEVGTLETRWADQANSNRTLEREKKNYERVVAQQEQLIAAVNAQPPGGRKSGSHVVAQVVAAEKPAAPAPSGGKPIYEQTFAPPFKPSGGEAKFATAETLGDGKPALVIDSDGKAGAVVLLWLKTDDVAGGEVKFTVLAKAEDISKPAAAHLGGKFGLMMKDGSGKTQWPAASVGGGSFDWKPLSFTVDIPYGVQSVAVMLGIQGCSGRILFRNLKAEAME